MPEPTTLTWLLTRLQRLIAASMATLQQQPFPVGAVAEAWEQEVARQLARYHAAAMLTGANTQQLTPAMRTKVEADLRSQLAYLKRFRLEIQDAAAFQEGWKARAAMYAGSIRVPYWHGATKMLPLPAMPAEGTQCLTHCKCSWEIDTLEGDGNYDAYWRRGADDSCQTCVQRAATWAPVRIREGVLQLG